MAYSFEDIIILSTAALKKSSCSSRNPRCLEIFLLRLSLNLPGMHFPLFFFFLSRIDQMQCYVFVDVLTRDLSIGFVILTVLKIPPVLFMTRSIVTRSIKLILSVRLCLSQNTILKPPVSLGHALSEYNARLDVTELRNLKYFKTYLSTWHCIYLRFEYITNYIYL